MDYSNWAQFQQNPNPNSDFSLLHTHNQSIGYTPNVIPNPYQQPSIDSHSALYLPPQPRPPGVDPPYVPPPGVDPSYVPPPVAVNYVQQPFCSEAQQGADAAAAAASYYPDPNVSWLAAIRLYGSASFTAGVSTPNPAIQPQWRPTWTKAPKKTKVVQSAWCDVCEIDCTSTGVLDQHKLGKKHLKNLKKLEVAIQPISAPIIAAPISAVIVDPPTIITAPPASIATSTSLPVPTPVPAPASTDAPIIGPQESSEKSKPKSKKSRKKSSARTEDLETKRRKVLEGGAAVNAVRVCSICNVVCNSDTVYNYHITSKKHATLAKKHALRASSVASAL